MLLFLFLFFSMLLLCSFFRPKELFQMKNGLTTSTTFFFLKMPKIWVGRTTPNGEKKGGLSVMIKTLMNNKIISMQFEYQVND